MTTTPDPHWVDLRTQLQQLAVDADPALRAALIEQLHSTYLRLARGGSTPGGLPFPDPTDPIGEGADAIRALAAAVESFRPPTIVGHVMTGSPDFGNTTSWVPTGWVPNSEFVKLSSSSRLQMRMNASARLGSGNAQYAQLGLQIGGTTYLVASAAFAQAPSASAIGGETVFPDIPAGEYTAVAMFRAQAASLFTIPAGTVFSYSIQEVA